MIECVFYEYSRQDSFVKAVKLQRKYVAFFVFAKMRERRKFWAKKMTLTNAMLIRERGGQNSE